MYGTTANKYRLQAGKITFIANRIFIAASLSECFSFAIAIGKFTSQFGKKTTFGSFAFIEMMWAILVSARRPGNASAPLAFCSLLCRWLSWVHFFASALSMGRAERAAYIRVWRASQRGPSGLALTVRFFPFDSPRLQLTNNPTGRNDGQ